MSTHLRRTTTLAAAVVALSATALPAFADNLIADGDAVVASQTTLNLGEICRGLSASAPAHLTLDRAGATNNNTWANATSVGISTLGASTAAGAVSADPTAATTLADWVTNSPSNDNAKSVSTSTPVTVTVPADAATGATLAGVTFTGTGAGYNGGTVSRSDALAVAWTVVDCAPANRAPEVSQQAADADGLEGDTLSTSGAFTDPDGDPLTITASGAGDLVDNGDGSFGWSLGTDDDASGSVTVTASDGELSVSQTFAYGAANVSPGVVAGLTPTGPCSVALSASFSDPGTADTHSADVSWGDGTADSADPATSPVTGSHTYASDGTYTVRVTVTDDDSGAGSDDAAVTTKLSAGPLLQPINASGTRSTFKLGSTIPVKVTVKGCDGALAGNLLPTVSLSRLDTTADGQVTEAAVTAVPTNGLSMRWDATAQQYVYNLSTKLSQQTGAALTTGTYRISVSDPSLWQPSSAVVDLRK